MAELHAVRWEVELYLKDVQGGARADEVTRLSNLDSLRAVVYAALLAQSLAGDVTRAANGEPTAPGVPRPPAIARQAGRSRKPAPPTRSEFPTPSSSPSAAPAADFSP